jgi:hypothetical protein
MIAKPPEGAATKANPAKAGDAKLRGYHAPFGSATPVEPPNGYFIGGEICASCTRKGLDLRQ